MPKYSDTKDSEELTCILYVNWICNHIQELALACLPLNHVHFEVMFHSLLAVDLLKEIKDQKWS